MPSTGKVFPYLNSAISPTTRSACFTSIVSPPLMTENLRERGERDRGRGGRGGEREEGYVQQVSIWPTHLVPWQFRTTTYMGNLICI